MKTSKIAKIFFYADTLHRNFLPLHRDSEKPMNGYKVLANYFKIMGSIFLFMFFAWRLKGFGKAITTPTRKSLVPAGIDSAMSRRHGFMTMTTEDKVSTKY